MPNVHSNMCYQSFAKCLLQTRGSGRRQHHCDHIPPGVDGRPPLAPVFPATFENDASTAAAG